MEKYIINGGNRLSGSVEVQTAKNAVLPLLAASILTEEPVTLHRCPGITDVKNMLKILEKLGCKIRHEGSSVTIDSGSASRHLIPQELAKELRSSIFILGSILSRFGYGKVSYPGGCDIGLRPIDLHINGLRQLGVVIDESGGFIECDGKNMRGGTVHLDFPSVGATENIMLAGAKARGRTVIRNAAKEPEICDLQDFINRMGGKVSGAGTPTIEIEGVNRLHGCDFTPIPDRIVAGTYLMAGAMCGCDMELTGCVPEHIYSLIAKLRESACLIDYKNDKIYIKQKGRLRGIPSIETSPFPGFPTDTQAQAMAMLSVAGGTSMIVEKIFETRFKHAAELNKMGADITVRGQVAVVRGVERLMGAKVYAHDLRGGAALVLAALSAEGQSEVCDIHYIDRGYEGMEHVLGKLGGDIKRVPGA